MHNNIAQDQPKHVWNNGQLTVAEMLEVYTRSGIKTIDVFLYKVERRRETPEMWEELERQVQRLQALEKHLIVERT